MQELEAAYARLVEEYRRGVRSAAANVLEGPIEAPHDGDLATLPDPGTEAHADLVELGRGALRRGELGLVVLAGGMATRFKYDRPKGLYPIADERSFLDWKIRWASARSRDLPIFIMTSFHTDAAIAEHVREAASFGHRPDRITRFEQARFRRLNPDGTPFVSPSGHEDDATPGHGDFPTAIRACGALSRFLAEGGRYLLFSNVDNLGATLDLAIVGHHVRSGRQMTAEVAAKAQGDKGGAPARVVGRPQLVEGFCFPQGFDQDEVRVFNTANYVFSAEALDREFDLPWYVVDKMVEDRPVIQFEHLAGDLSRELTTGFLVVDRNDRFIPVKSQADVPRAQELIRAKAERLAAEASHDGREAIMRAST